MTEAITPAPVALRAPAHRVSPRAVGYWRTSALLGDLVLVAAAVLAYALVPERPWWATVLLVLLVVGVVVHVVAMPTIRYRVHRWEVSELAIHTLSGWIGRETRIAPISRVQTVDSRQGALMRLFGLASLTVTTASAAGPITIDCLDADTARRLVAQLTEVTAASEGDAT
ncbi:hypothetical protein EXE58_02805 [Nocardioides seonyuensis]|uniref:YdbS-like PH domain-containing protein n=1 Tax=Nocardioides seonyuensis TaxID=2518371 RepID=A0A4V1BLY6_9ACTN|nr:PH domain-containing protein [Nocardioides seonyuensis]QBX54502.1 hypothetical protein EXE58_02805 [Nocardioides seonyuensis]